MQSISFGLAWTFVGFINLVFGAVWFVSALAGVISVAFLFQVFCLLFTVFAGGVLCVISLAVHIRKLLVRPNMVHGGLSRSELEEMWMEMKAKESKTISGETQHKETVKPKDAYEELLAIHEGADK